MISMRFWTFSLVLLCFGQLSIGNNPRVVKVVENTVAEINKRSSTTVLYRVSVKTADEFGAGTDADVFIRIVGTAGSTGVVELTKSGNSFERGQVDEFVFVEEAVGTLKKVEIKRNEGGLFANWKLALVTVQPAGSLVYKFAFDEWIQPNIWTFSYGG